MIARYEKIDLQQVSVRLDSSGGCEVLELNIMMPEDAAAAGTGKPLDAAGGRRSAGISGVA